MQNFHCQTLNKMHYFEKKAFFRPIFRRNAYGMLEVWKQKGKSSAREDSNVHVLFLIRLFQK
ncbi:MAG: hypothetical protein CMG32_07285 [Candidatus Marinimicrobia bacterium]|jgi:hypothetical protein|nr:hypothetical protein [Candidatus Neomarinimicrobiota bacterium]